MPFAKSLHLAKDLWAVAVAQVIVSALLLLPLRASNELSALGDVVTESRRLTTCLKTTLKKKLSG